MTNPSIEIPTPAELRKEQESKDEGMLSLVIGSIAEDIRRKYDLGNEVIETSVAASSVNERVKQAIVSTFSKKGWEVNFVRIVPDQRDGDYYEVHIRAKPSPRN